MIAYLVTVAEKETKSWATEERSTGGQEPWPGRQLRTREHRSQ